MGIYHLASIICSTFAISAVAQLENQQPLNADLNSTVSNGCQAACTNLLSSLGSSIVYLQANGLPESYNTLYFSKRQQAVIPACWVQPQNKEDVALAVRILVGESCHFAVKSGGHCMYEGCSGAHEGATLDLRLLNQIDVVDDNESVETSGVVAQVGTGSTWDMVYDALDLLNLTVIGGRSGTVGVGGFILGGGINFRSRQYGWALDNVRNFEVVLANGSITNANYNSNSDLYLALRGGGSNFGVVTRFDLETYPNHAVWGGQNWYLMSDITAQRQPFAPAKATWLGHRFGILIKKAICAIGYCATSTELISAIKDITHRNDASKSGYYIALSYVKDLGIYVSGTMFVHEGKDNNPPAFEKLKPLKAVYNTMRVTNSTSMVKEITSWNYAGFRQDWSSLTIQADSALLSQIFEIFASEIETLTHVPDLVPAVLVQTIGKEEIGIFQRHGGNSLGFYPDEGPVLLISLPIRWSGEEFDEAVKAVAQSFRTRVTALAKEMGLFHRYVYANYASGEQDIFEGYGIENREKLRAIASKYDPDRVFDKLVRGGFKLGP